MYPPKWFTGVSLKQVAPTKELFTATWLSDEAYEKRFRNEVLAQVDALEFYNLLERMGRGKDVALCCFEKDVKDCHRKLVGEWLTRELGIEVKEFGQKEKPTQPTETYEEPSLF